MNDLAVKATIFAMMVFGTGWASCLAFQICQSKTNGWTAKLDRLNDKVILPYFLFMLFLMGLELIA